MRNNKFLFLYQIIAFYVVNSGKAVQLYDIKATLGVDLCKGLT